MLWLAHWELLLIVTEVLQETEPEASLCASASFRSADSREQERRKRGFWRRRESLDQGELLNWPPLGTKHNLFDLEGTLFQEMRWDGYA